MSNINKKKINFHFGEAFSGALEKLQSTSNKTTIGNSFVSQSPSIDKGIEKASKIKLKNIYNISTKEIYDKIYDYEETLDEFAKMNNTDIYHHMKVYSYTYDIFKTTLNDFVKEKNLNGYHRTIKKDVVYNDLIENQERIIKEYHPNVWSKKNGETKIILNSPVDTALLVIVAASRED